MAEQAKKKVPQIRFKGFSNPWEEKNLGGICEIVGGGTPSTSTPGYWGGDIDWYSPTEIGDKVYVDGSERKITRLGLEKSSAQVLPAHKTVLFTSRAGIGDMAILKKAAATNQGFQSFVLNEGIDPYFIYSAGDLIKQYALKHASGSTFLEISSKQLEKMVLLTPSEQEQQKIGAYFENLDRMIGQHQRKHEKLVTLKKAMLKKMFPAPGATTPEIRFKGFSDSWDEKALAGLSSLITKGTTPLEKSGDGSINFVKVESINGLTGEITISAKITEAEHNGYLKRSQLKKDDILFSIAGTLGRVTVVHEKYLPANTNQALAIVRLSHGNVEYVTTYLKGKAIGDFIKQNPTIGAQPNLSLEQIGSLKILLPSEREQKKIGSYFRQLDDLIARHVEQVEKLKQIKTACLGKMFV